MKMGKFESEDYVYLKRAVYVLTVVGISCIIFGWPVLIIWLLIAIFALLGAS